MKKDKMLDEVSASEAEPAQDAKPPKPPTAWEVVDQGTDDGLPATFRLQVPGGWLYGLPGAALAFVKSQ